MNDNTISIAPDEVIPTLEQYIRGLELARLADADGDEDLKMAHAERLKRMTSKAALAFAVVCDHHSTFEDQINKLMTDLFREIPNSLSYWMFIGKQADELFPNGKAN